MAKATKVKTPAPVSKAVLEEGRKGLAKSVATQIDGAKPVTQEAKDSHNEVFEKAVMDEVKKLKEEIVQLRADLRAVDSSVSKNRGNLEKLKSRVSIETDRLRRLHIRSHMAYEG